MKYVGLDPRTRLLRWTLFAALIVIVVAGTGGQAVAAVVDWLRHEYDRLPWYATRITGLLAYLALGASVVYGLLLSTGFLDAINHRAVSFTLHQDLSSMGLALALVHAAILMIDRSVPFSVSEVLIPFAGPYRPLWVGIGQLSLVASAVVLFSFYARRRIGQKAWRRLHYLSFLAFLGITAHGLMAGSDTQATWTYLMYLAMTACVLFLLGYRIILSVADRRSPAAAAGAVALDDRRPPVPGPAMPAGGAAPVPGIARRR